jgi:endo-1,4-beta-xylanase
LPSGLTQYAFRSPSNNADVGYSVYLPPSYAANPTKRFPVVYWLHGANGNEIKSLWLAKFIDNAVKGNKMRAMIVVFPNAGGRSMWCDVYDGTVLTESMLIKELIPLIDSKFRTINHRSGRFLEGFSMGGFGSARLLFKYPELFSSAVTYGSPYNNASSIIQTAEYSTAFGNNSNYFTANSPYTLGQEYSNRSDKNLLPIRMRIVVGSEDPNLSLNTQFKSFLYFLKIPSQYVELTGVKHDPQPYYQAVGIEGFNFH